MKRATVLCLFLILSGTALATGGGKLAQTDKAFDAFWQKFKTAVAKGDKDAIVGLSRFPIKMPARVRNIKDAADLRLRYREVFNKYVNATKCFANKEEGQGKQDEDNPKRASASCFNNLGDVINYDFELTNTGWKFVRLDKYALPD